MWHVTPESQYMGEKRQDASPPREMSQLVNAAGVTSIGCQKELPNQWRINAVALEARGVYNLLCRLSGMI